MQVQIFNTDGDDEKKKKIKILHLYHLNLWGNQTRKRIEVLTLWYLKNLRILDAEAGVLSEGSAENGGGEVGESTVDGLSEERE